MIYAVAGITLLTIAILWTRWAVRWGATDAELAEASTAEAWFVGLPGKHLRMTRAVSINSAPLTVWRWTAQLGRGAGWASYDWIDNGRRRSAQHLVSWIPDPVLGDASAIGFLRHLEPDRELIWWSGEVKFAATRLWLAWAYRIEPRGDHSRLFLHIDIRASGLLSLPVRALLQPLDSIMAIRQLKNLKEHAERFGERSEDPANPETGVRDQYQLHHAIFASGDQAGRAGAGIARSAWERARERARVSPNP